MRLLTLLIPLLLLVPAQRVQQDVRASPASLKGIKRLYLDTGRDSKNRERIAREIKRAGLGVELLASREGAELVLFFASEKVKTAIGVETRPPVTGVLPDKPEVIYKDLELGTGTAYVPAPSGGGQVLFRWEGQEKFTTSPATKFATAFVKEYRKANRIR